MALPSKFPGSPVKASHPNFAWIGVLVLLGAGLGVVTAYLIVTGNWYVALGLLLAVPAIILLHNYPLSGLLIWLALAPFLMTTETSVERTAFWVIHRALPPVAVGILVVSAALRVNQRRLPRLGWTELAMAGYLVASFVSILTLNADPEATVYRFYDRVFIPMCLYLLVRLSAPSEADLQRLVPVFFFLAVSQSLIGILSWFAPRVLPSEWLGQLGERTIGSLVNPSTYSAALVFAGVLLLQAGLNRKPGLVRTLYLSAFVLTLFSNFLSFSRASWLAEILVSLGLMLLYPKVIIRIALIAVPVAIILAGGLFADQLSWANERLYSEEAQGSALDRLPTFLAATRMFEAKPAFGWGYGNFDRYDREFQGRVGNFASDNKDHTVHNQFLMLLAEQGLTGTLLFLAPLVGLLIQTLKSLPRAPRHAFMSRKALIVLWLIMLNYVVLNSFTNPIVVFGLGLWWLTLGLIANTVRAQLALDSQRIPAAARQTTSWPRGRKPQPHKDGAYVHRVRRSL